LWSTYWDRVKRGEEPGRVLDDLGVSRYCCRRTLMTSITYAENLSKYYSLTREGFIGVGEEQ
jgi:DNA-directed RNA polymerase subunit N